MTTLDTPLEKVVGAKTARAMAGLELFTAGDLLRHYPRRYAERGELTDLGSLPVGEHVTVVAEVAKVVTLQNKNGGYRTVVEVGDGRGTLQLTFFHKVPGRRPPMLKGRRGLFAGQVTMFKSTRQLTHPVYKMLTGSGDEDVIEEFARPLIPVYPATKDMPSWSIAKSLTAVLGMVELGEDPLPASVRERYGLCGLSDALRWIHRPEDMAEIGRARKRLKWEEAFVVQAVLAQRRADAMAVPAVSRPLASGGLLDDFDKRLPFSLTRGQVEVGEIMAADLGQEHPMHRLLQGEVGAGKTVVAVRAMLQVVDAGGQAALLAPTEVLAQQHHRSIVALLGDLAQGGMFGGTGVALLTGSQGAAARRSAMLEAASGAAGIVVGTHALLEEKVQFADLGMVVIDEQHRFGVEQRDALRDKANGARPHVLVMTATPIPRTVAMTVYGDLDVSALTELPAGRSPIESHVVPLAEKPHFLPRVWERLHEEAAAGRQCYVVCPRIGDAEGDEGDLDSLDDASEGERRPARAVLDVAEELSSGPLADLRVGVLHGRLAPDVKDAVMRAFAAGSVDVLVATTVIEVGVDVPNASVMVVMDADRFGVSQLHQLRGRVGRGGLPGLCLLVTDFPAGSPPRDRLDAVAITLDGFELSRVDLEQRREGDVLGAKQSGRKSKLRMLQLLRDEELINAAREEASSLIEADPSLAEQPGLRAAIDSLVGEQGAEYLEKT